MHRAVAGRFAVFPGIAAGIQVDPDSRSFSGGDYQPFVMLPRRGATRKRFLSGKDSGSLRRTNGYVVLSWARAITPIRTQPEPPRGAAEKE